MAKFHIHGQDSRWYVSQNGKRISPIFPTWHKAKRYKQQCNALENRIRIGRKTWTRKL